MDVKHANICGTLKNIVIESICLDSKQCLINKDKNVVPKNQTF